MLKAPPPDVALDASTSSLASSSRTASADDSSDVDVDDDSPALSPRTTNNTAQPRITLRLPTAQAEKRRLSTNARHDGSDVRQHDFASKRMRYDPQPSAPIVNPPNDLVLGLANYSQFAKACILNFEITLPLRVAVRESPKNAASGDAHRSSRFSSQMNRNNNRRLPDTADSSFEQQQSCAPASSCSTLELAQ